MRHKLPAKISVLGAGQALEMYICFAALAFLVLIPFLNFLFSKIKLPIPNANFLLTHFFLVSSMLAAMLTAKNGEHISITAVQFIKSEKIKGILVFIVTLISAFLAALLCWNSISFIRYALMGKTAGFLTDRIFTIIMPVGFAVIAIRMVLGLKTWKKRIPAFAAIILGCFAALPAIAKVIWGFEPPEPFFSWVNYIYDISIVLNVPVILFLILAALAGMPIFAAIGGIAMTLLMTAGHEPDVVSREIYSALTDTDIIAIPLFTLTGFFLSESKAGERLVRTFKILFGWMPGGIIVATVIICAFFTSFTGASGVTILALGGILFTILNKNKYSEKFSVGLLTSVGGIGLMFPPSLPIILVWVTTSSIFHYLHLPMQYDVIDYFIGAVIPGIILIAVTIIAGLILSRNVKIEKETYSSKEAFASVKDSFFEILLPVILIAGYFSGFLTLVEAGALSVIYVIIIEVFIKKDIAAKDILKVVHKAVPIIGGVLAILAMAKALSYAFIDSGVPEQFTSWMQSTISSKFVFLLLLNLGLLVLGCLMDIFSAILVFLPLIVPLGIAYEINPVHLGLIFVINLEAGFLTPPVGMNLFLASYRFKKPFTEICTNVAPFLLVRLVVVLLITYVPPLSTFLINLIR